LHRWDIWLSCWTERTSGGCCGGELIVFSNSFERQQDLFKTESNRLFVRLLVESRIPGKAC
jgi:hypothetical protein